MLCDCFGAGLKGSFRGYPLNGKVMQLPNGYVGLVLHESVKPNTDKEDRKFYIVNNFDSIVYWNWDKEPSKNDALDQALTWIDIAEVVGCYKFLKNNLQICVLTITFCSYIHQLRKTENRELIV